MMALNQESWDITNIVLGYVYIYILSLALGGATHMLHVCNIYQHVP